MYKIVCFLRKTSFIPIVVAVLTVFMYFMNLDTMSIWLAHIFTVIYFMPISYELTGSFNLAFCCNPVLICHQNSGFRKKVKLNSFFKKLFCGYDNQGNMLWLVFFYQCILFLYICVFVFLNIVFIGEVVTNNVSPAIWIKIWGVEIIAQYIIFAVVVISSYVKNVYLWSKERQNKKTTKISNISWVKSDIKILKNRKVIKQKNEISTFLKQNGVRTDNHKRYVVNSADMDCIKEVLVKEFPKLYITFEKNEKGMRIIKMYAFKKEDLLIEIYEKH